MSIVPTIVLAGSIVNIEAEGILSIMLHISNKKCIYIYIFIAGCIV